MYDYSFMVYGGRSFRSNLYFSNGALKCGSDVAGVKVTNNIVKRVQPGDQLLKFGETTLSPVGGENISVKKGDSFKVDSDKYYYCFTYTMVKGAVTATPQVSCYKLWHK